MKCSNCRLWKTEECKSYPDAKDWDNVETCRHFQLSPLQQEKLEKMEQTSFILGVSSVICIPLVFLGMLFNMFYFLPFIGFLLGVAAIVEGICVLCKYRNYRTIVPVVFGFLGVAGNIFIAVLVALSFTS